MHKAVTPMNPLATLTIGPSEKARAGEDLIITTPKGGRYCSAGCIGSGASDNAFAYYAPERDHFFVVLAPKKARPNILAIQRKLRFFKTIYGAGSVQLLLLCSKQTYRFISPGIPGQSLQNLIIQKELCVQDLPQIFLLVAQALAHCLDKGLIFLDLNPNNIICQKEKGQYIRCALIDGGEAVPIHTDLPDNFSKMSADICEEQQKSFIVAPECWFLIGTSPPKATPAMMVFSMAALIEHLYNTLTKWWEPIPRPIKQLITRCQETKTEKRPTLPEVITALNLLLAPSEPSPPSKKGRGCSVM